MLITNDIVLRDINVIKKREKKTERKNMELIRE